MFKKLSIITIIASLFGCGIANSGKKMPEGRLLSFEFEKTARSIYPVEYYHVDTDGAGQTWLTNISQHGDTTKVAVGEQTLAQLRDIIQRDKLYRLKESYTPMGDVRDGWQWRFVARFENDEKIYSECTNTKPGNLKLDNIRKFLRTTLENETMKGVPKGDVESLRYEVHSLSSGKVDVCEMVSRTMAFGHGKPAREPITIYSAIVTDPDTQQMESISLSGKQLEEITEIVRKYRMFEYGKYPSPKETDGGEKWRLEIRFTSGEIIKASGHNNKPDNGGLDVLHDYFKSLLKQ